MQAVIIPTDLIESSTASAPDGTMNFEVIGLNSYATLFVIGIS